MNPALRFTIITSLLLHALLYWGFNADLSALFQPPEPQEEYSLEFELTPQPQPKVEAPKADLPPPPKHLQDDINKANTSDGLAESGSKQAIKKSPKKVAQQPKKLVESQSYNPDLLSNYLKQKKQIEEAKSQDDGLANMQEMDDSALDDSLIKSPKEQLEEEKARWFNDVFRRMQEQLKHVWVKPKGVEKGTWGELRIELSSEGYLMDVSINLPSGNYQLDQSALRAVRSIRRFELPRSPRLNQYYRDIKLRYSG
jgi:TonB family protein